MRKVFWDDPYQCSLPTTVASVVGNEVLFDATIAFSFSGGQESDLATVNSFPILNSRIHDQDIIYILPDNHGLMAGDKVEMKIDWLRRNRLMRLHFACELILVLINKLFANKKSTEELQPEEIDNVGIAKTGAHIAENGARIDFRLGENITKYFEPILSEYNKIIQANLPIEKGYINELAHIRYWRIQNIAKVPCGGTHVNSTAEVGMVKLKRDNAGKGIERIKITLVDPSVKSK